MAFLYTKTFLSENGATQDSMRETLQAYSEISLNWAQLYKLGLAVCDRKLKIVTYRIKTIFLIWKSRDGMYLIQTGCSFYLEVFCSQGTDYSCAAWDPSVSCFSILTWLETGMQICRILIYPFILSFIHTSSMY